jgi:hypothetical protein
VTRSSLNKNATARLACATLLAIVAVPLSQCVAEEMPQNVEVALNDNLRALSEVRLEWKLTRRSTLDLAKLLGEIRLLVAGPGGAFLQEERAEFLYDAGKSRARFDFVMPSLKPEAESKLVSTIGSAAGAGQTDSKANSAQTKASRLDPISLSEIEGYLPCASELSWDGDAVYYGTPPLPDNEGSLTVYPVSTSFVNFDTWHSDYWRMIGIYVPRLSSEFASGMLMQSEILKRKAEGAVQFAGELLTDDDVKCLVVRIQERGRHIEFYLDAQLGCAVRQRIVRNEGGALLSKSTMSSFEKGGQEQPVWLPRVCKIDYYQCPDSQMPSPASTSVLYSAEYTLLDLKIGAEAASTFDRSSFAIAYAKGGTRVQDGRTTVNNEPLAYRVPANADDLQDVIEHAKTGKKFVPRDLRPGPWRWPLVITNVAVIVLLLVVWWGRRRA